MTAIDIGAGIVAAGQVVNLDHIGVGGGVDKLAAADIDTHVGDGLGGVSVVEEHQVAGLELILGHGHAVGQLVRGGAVQGVAELGVHILCKAGAVKGGGTVAAPHIGAAQEILGIVGDLLAQAGGGGSNGGAVAPGARGVLHCNHIVAADIARGAVICNLVPAVVDAHDVHHSAVAQGGHPVIAGAGAAAHVQRGAAGADLAVADFHIGSCLHVQIFPGHIALNGLVVHLVPAVARVLQNDDGVAAGSSGQDGGVGAGALAKAEGIGVDGAHTHAGGGSAGDGDGGEGGAENCDAQELSGRYHWYQPP